MCSTAKYPPENRHVSVITPINNVSFFRGLSFLQKLAGNLRQKSFLVYAGDMPQTRTHAQVLPWHRITGFFDSHAAPER